MLENVNFTLWNTEKVVTFESDLHWPQLRTELWTTGISWAWSFHQVVLPRNVADQEALAGKISYFPASRALPIKYFPYLVSNSRTEKLLAYNNVEQYLVLFWFLITSFQANFLTLSTLRARGTRSTRRLATTLPLWPSRWTSQLIFSLHLTSFSFVLLFPTALAWPSCLVQVDPATKGQLVHMECRAYYRGVKHDKKDKLGLVQFKVQVL